MGGGLATQRNKDQSEWGQATVVRSVLPSPVALGATLPKFHEVDPIMGAAV